MSVHPFSHTHPHSARYVGSTAFRYDIRSLPRSTAFRYDIRSLPHSKTWANILVPLALLVLLVGCGGPNPATVPTPTSALQVTSIDLHLPAAALNAPVVRPLPDTTLLHVSITFKVNQQELDQLHKKKVQSGQNQNVQDIANKLGISDSEYKEIKSVFGVENATLNLNSLHTNLTIDAKAKTFAQVFQIKFVIHQLNGRTFYAPTSNPKVPTFLATQILAITGLDNYSLPPRQGGALVHLNSVGLSKHTAADCNAQQGTLTPAAVAKQYGYDQFYKAGFHGEGMTVNLVEIDTYDKAAVQNYANCVNYRGKLSLVDLNTKPSVGEESTIDIEMIMGLAPAANIMDYETNLGDSSASDAFTLINDELQRIINDNSNNTSSGNVVSISLGLYEAGLTKDNIAAIDQSLKILTQVENMTVFIASGDCGAFDNGTYGDRSVDFPPSDPWAVAVGGTVPAVDQQNNLFEQVWSDGSDHSACHNAWGSGGGLSQDFKRPNWQDAPGVQNQYSNGMRQMPDIAAFANDLAAYYQGQWTIAGGTSFATPIWATGMLLVNQDLIQQTQTFFAGPSIFYDVAKNGASNNLQPYTDVTQGNNLYYPATPGWDFATGLGTPNLPDFFNTLLAMAKQS